MRVALTGASGALGRVLLARLIEDGAERINVFSRDEQKRAALVKDFGWYPGLRDRVYAGDVRDPHRLSEMFAGCEVVVHAAARKVVTAHADEPTELLKTNVYGTQNVIDACLEAGVRKLLFISSDKAVQPENIYGTSKMYGEHLIVSGNAKTWPKGLRMSALRYGNCLGSTGSVVVHWRNLIANGQPVPISDARMTRFWVRLEQAADFVMRAVEMMRGGEVFVPNLPAAPITLLAQALGAEGLTFTGIRPGGEKLHESLLSPSEVRRTKEWRGFYVVPPFDEMRTWDATPWPGVPVPETLSYTSNVWPWQLDVDGMRALLGEPAMVRA